MSGKVAGVYAVLNRSRRLIYIGSSGHLFDRRRAWASALSRIERGASEKGIAKSLIEAIRGTAASEWEFVILEEWRDDKMGSLSAREQSQLARARELFGEGVLNVSPVSAPSAALKVLHARLEDL